MRPFIGSCPVATKWNPPLGARVQSQLLIEGALRTREMKGCNAAFGRCWPLQVARN